MKNNDWFTSWFDTPYYHILYKNRDDSDAQLFIKNITSFLKLNKEATIVDLPCGKGRHSRYLNSLGYKVIGGDISSNSINFAKQFENDRLEFKLWDMRSPIENKYDAIFNLFTSFGYFETDEEHILVLKNLKDALKKDGVLVLDFLNCYKLNSTLVAKEIKTVDGIDFHLEREIKDGYILKHISFTDKGKNHSYTERVKYMDLALFESYFKAAGFTISKTFGDYHLNSFDKNTSDRLILVAS